MALLVRVARHESSSVRVHVGFRRDRLESYPQRTRRRRECDGGERIGRRRRRRKTK
jgi:hypothetical protein